VGIGILLLVIGGIVGINVIVGFGRGEPDALAGLLPVILLAAIGIALCANTSKARTAQIKSRAAQVVRTGYGRLALRGYEIMLTPERFCSRTELSELRTKWIGVFAIKVNPADTHAFVSTGPASAIIIPARAFDSMDAFEAFVDRMRAYRSSAPSLLSQCPACSYDLHGTMIDRCPECGWQPAGANA